MLDHLAIQCADVDASAAFYGAVLAPLGGGRLLELGPVVGFGVGQVPDFWLGPCSPPGRGPEPGVREAGAEHPAGGASSPGEGFRETHIAFRAPDRDAVRAFFEAAVAAGAEVLHEPREWPEYHAGYYGAFVRDPDGNNVEAVCHAPA